MKQLATSPAADPSLRCQMENHNRLAMEAGTAAFQLNYPFVYPSMKADNPKLFKNFKWAPYPEVDPGQPAKSPSAASTWRSARTPAPGPGLPGRAVPARPGRTSSSGATVGGVPPTITSLYRRPKLFAGLPVPRRHPAALAERQRPAADAGLPGRLDRHLAPGVAAVGINPAEHRADRWRASSTTPCSRRAWSREPRTASGPGRRKECADEHEPRPRPGRGAAGTSRQEAPLSEGARAERRLGWLLCAPAVIVMVARHRLPDRLRHLPVAAALQPGSPAGGKFVGLQQLRGRAELAVLVARAQGHR